MKGSTSATVRSRAVIKATSFQTQAEAAIGRIDRYLPVFLRWMFDVLPRVEAA
jgi:hypothetical protein